IDLIVGKPIDPSQVARSVARIDSLYQSEGYYLARVKVDTIKDREATTLIFHVEEGRRLAVSGVEIVGNKALTDKENVAAMNTKPEAFLWWRNGEFDTDKYNEDLSKNIPKLYGQHGYIDMLVVSDTLIVDKDLGKALVRITVREGPQYKI